VFWLIGKRYTKRRHGTHSYTFFFCHFEAVHANHTMVRSIFKKKCEAAIMAKAAEIVEDVWNTDDEGDFFDVDLDSISSQHEEEEEEEEEEQQHQSKVRFDLVPPQKREIMSRYDYTERERQKCWYSREDQLKMHERRFTIQWEKMQKRRFTAQLDACCALKSSQFVTSLPKDMGVFFNWFSSDGIEEPLKSLENKTE
jgi:hypothetical protein